MLGFILAVVELNVCSGVGNSIAMLREIFSLKLFYRRIEIRDNYVVNWEYFPRISNREPSFLVKKFIRHSFIQAR